MGLVLMLGLTACGDDAGSGAGAVDLAGRELWSVARTVDGADQPLVAGSTVRLTFTDSGVSANAGCNTIFGDARIEGDELVVGALASTSMACEPDLMDQDQWLADLLSSRPTLAVDGDEVSLTSGTTVLTLVDRRVADPDRPLVGTTWTVDTLISGDAASSLPAGVDPPTLTIGDDGRFTAFLGCNRANGPVAVGDTTLTFGPAATTRMMCPPDAMDVEATVLAVLDGEVTWSIEGPALHLDGPHGALRLVAG
ncbi:MAG TPA: META domain-containing protein [Acidimicrobiales bacterium]|nr:META domain-containing protein [Acidimicrobiales bacterium]